MEPEQLPDAWKPKEEASDYQKAINAFEEADGAYQELAGKVQDGTILYELANATTMQEMVERFRQVLDALKSLLDERNAKLQEAQNAMRSAITPKEGQKRGPDGRADFLKYGRFEANTKTSRSFKPDLLLAGVQAKGLYGRLFEQTMHDKKSGEVKPIVEQEWKINFEQVKNFLRENNCEDVIDYAYKEEELSPAVSGPKPVLFMSEVKK